MSFITETTKYKRCPDCRAFVPYENHVIHKKYHSTHDLKKHHIVESHDCHLHNDQSEDNVQGPDRRGRNKLRPSPSCADFRSSRSGTPDFRAHAHLARSSPLKPNLSHKKSRLYASQHFPVTPQSPTADIRKFSGSSLLEGNHGPLPRADSVDLWFQRQVPREHVGRGRRPENLTQQPFIVDDGRVSGTVNGQVPGSGYLDDTSRASSVLLPSIHDFSGFSAKSPEPLLEVPENHLAADYPSPTSSADSPNWWRDLFRGASDEEETSPSSGQTLVFSPPPNQLGLAYEPTLPADSPKDSVHSPVSAHTGCVPPPFSETPTHVSRPLEGTLGTLSGVCGWTSYPSSTATSTSQPGVALQQRCLCGQSFCPDSSRLFWK